MMEHEKKVLLSEDEYISVLNSGYNFEDEKIHINHYYDTDSLKYNKRGVTCRIRESNMDYVATVKNHLGAETSSEKSTHVKNQMDTSSFHGMDVKYFGSMKTVRREAKPLKGITVMLDCNKYLDKVDYELEVEYDVGYDKVAACLLEFISDALFYKGLTEFREEIVLRANTLSNKSQRFFQRFSELKLYHTPISCKNKVYEFGEFVHAQIDVWSGKLKAVIEGIDFGGIVPLLNARFIYDGDLKKDVANHKIDNPKGVSEFYKMQFADGWHLSLIQSMVAKRIACNGVEYDGYMFTNEGGEKSYFIPIPDVDFKRGNFKKYVDVDNKNRIYDATAHKLYSDGNSYWFDMKGRLCKILDSDKNCMEIMYIGNRIIGASDNNGNEIFFDYNICAQIKTVTTSDGRKAVYSYDLSSGRLISIVYPDESRICFKYTNNKISCIELLNSKKKGIYKVEYYYKGDKIKKAQEFFLDTSGRSRRHTVSKYIYYKSGNKTIVYDKEKSYRQTKEKKRTMSKSVYKFNKYGKVLSCYVYPMDSKHKECDA